jgi:hypothetical protein
MKDMSDNMSKKVKTVFYRDGAGDLFSVANRVFLADLDCERVCELSIYERHIYFQMKQKHLKQDF